MAVRTVLVCETQVPLVRGGAELLVRQLVDELRPRGFETDRVSVPFKWYPKQEILPHAAAWGLLDLSREQRPADRPGDRHQVPHLPGAASAQGLLAGAPAPRRLRAGGHAVLRLRPRRARRGAARSPDGHRRAGAVGECVGALHDLAARSRRGCARYNGLGSTPLYHPPLLASRLTPGPYGDYVLSVARLEQNKRVDLAVRSVAVLARAAVLRRGRRGQPARAGRAAPPKTPVSRTACRFIGAVSDDALLELYRGALARRLRAVRRGLRPGHARRLPGRPSRSSPPPTRAAPSSSSTTASTAP